METVVHNIRDLDNTTRTAAEHLVGHVLLENQQLVIHVVNLGLPLDAEQPGQIPSGDVPPWWNIYAGLSDAEIEKLDEAIRQRADFTRVFE
jgi:hypothetical protein